MTTLGVFSPMLLQELDTRGCDFSARLLPAETITAATCDVTVTHGVDVNVALMRVGAAAISGGTVTALLSGIAAGVAGVRYLLVYEAVTSTGRELRESAAMTFRAP